MPFLLGPLGALRPLPSPALGSPPGATATRVGAVHRSLTGRPTVDRLAVRRAWSLSWPYLDTATHAYLDAIHLGLVAGPLWLLDPQRVNRLPVPIAGTGSATRGTAGFTATTGTLAFTTAVPAAGLPLAGGLAWTPAASGGQVTADPLVPLVAGEAVTFSAHVAASAPVRLVLTTHTAAGALIGTEQTEPATPGTAGARLALTVTVTAPAGAASCRVGLATAGAGLIATSAWQLEAGAAPTGWQPGGGAALVLLADLSVTYPIPGAHQTAVTLLEV